MKQAKLKVGVKGVEPVIVPIDEPENVEDLQKLSKGDPKVLVRWATRGYRIECQERSGARDHVRDFSGKIPPEQLAKEVTEIIAKFDPKVLQPRTGRPKKPVEVKLPKGQKTFTAADLAKILAESGIKANVSEAAAA